MTTIKSRRSHNDLMKDKTVEATLQSLHNNELYFVTQDGFYKVPASYVPFKDVPKDIVDKTTSKNIPELFVIVASREDVDKFLETFSEHEDINFSIYKTQDGYSVEVFAMHDLMQYIKAMFGFTR